MLIGKGAEHQVYQYIGDDQQLKSKCIRIRKPREICNISKFLIQPFNQTQWTPLKKYFAIKQPYQIEEQQCEIMDNLFYDVEFAIEIKPKTFLPILSHKQLNKDLNDPKNQRFFMMQLWKAKNKLNKQGKDIYQSNKIEIDSIISKYDPRKFYNGKIENLFDAIIDLQELPENNYKLYKNGWVKQLEEFNNEEIASIISETLILEDLIPQLKSFFHMIQQMNLTIEEAYEAFQKLKSKDNVDFTSIVQGKCTDTEITSLAFKILTFSSFSALSDISIIGSFRKYGNGKFLDINNKRLYYQYTIIDCDLKSCHKFEDYMSTIDELIKLRQYYDSLQ